MKKPYIPFRKNTRKQKTDNTSTGHIAFRLNLLSTISFILLFILVVQLFRLDVVDYKKFEARLNDEHETIVKLNNAPRGSIYDNAGKVLVTNKANQAIIYTKPRGATTQQMAEVANRLSKLITMPTKNITERDKKDYYLAYQKHNEEVLDRIPKNELIKTGEDPGKTYQLQLKYVSKSDIDYNQQQKEAVAIYKKLNGAQTLTPTVVKNNDVTNEEIAVVGENEDKLDGVATSVDWTRSYTKASDSMRSILGTVSSEKTGLPADLAKEYLAKGYSLNDRVGLSYLEKTYESYLHGVNGKVEIFTNNKQEIVKQEVVKEPEKGDNLKLTIDAEFQEKLNDIVKRYAQNIVGSSPCSEGAYVVVTNPKTGGIVGISGYSRDPKTGEIDEDTLGTINKAFIPGSVVKPATITSGYENKVISDNQTFIDQPLVIGQGAGAVRKSSVFNRYGQVPVNAVKALEVSSNVYMMNIVFAMLGQHYTPNMVMSEDISPIKKLRKTYAEYGLGTETGVDVNGESTGLINKQFYDKDGNLIPGTQGNMLDLSYGNYDTYTPLQLAQYTSTIYNDGKRIAPHFVEGIYANNSEGGLGKEIKKITPKVMNTIHLTQDQWNILHEGMYQVVHGAQGTATDLQGCKYNISAKTGTAETSGYNRATGQYESTLNLNLISYINKRGDTDAKLSVTVVLPKVSENSHENVALAKEVYDLYYKLYGNKEQQ